MLHQFIRPPSPPPARAYRAPINTGIRNALGGRAAVGNLLGDLQGAGLTSNQGGHHVDIHIAILTPPNRYVILQSNKNSTKIFLTGYLHLGVVV